MQVRRCSRPASDFRPVSVAAVASTDCEFSRKKRKLIAFGFAILAFTAWMLVAGFASAEDLEIEKKWTGELELGEINLLPEEQREAEVGYFSDPATFRVVWKAMFPKNEMPEFDPDSEMVVFTRNTKFFNRLRLGKVSVDEGTLNCLLISDRSAIPIRETVNCLIFIVPKDKVSRIQMGNTTIDVKSLNNDE